jgi:hypothetical protein
VEEISLRLEARTLNEDEVIKVGKQIFIGEEKEGRNNAFHSCNHSFQA